MKKRQLQMIETPLLLRLQDFEKRHDHIVSYAFDVFTSVQKQYFAEISNAFTGYSGVVPPESVPPVPLILNHGSRQDIDEAKRSIATSSQQPTSSLRPDDSMNPSPSVHGSLSNGTPSPQSHSALPPQRNPPLPPSLRPLQRPPIPPPPPPSFGKSSTHR